MDEHELYTRIKNHLGHAIEIANYGDGDNIAIECLRCCEVIIDVDRPGFKPPEAFFKQGPTG